MASVPKPTGDSREGFPYQCIRDFRPRPPAVSAGAAYQPPSPSGAAIRKGTQGKVIIVLERVQSAYVSMVMHDPLNPNPVRSDDFRKGWVPLSCIWIGNVRKYGELLIRLPKPSIPPTLAPAAPLGSLGQGTQLRRAYACLFQTMAEDMDKLPFYDIQCRKRIATPEDRNKLVNIIMSGIPNAVANVLNNPSFTVSELGNAVVQIANKDGTTGIYAIFYQFVQQQITSFEQYTGQSVNCGARNAAHAAAAATGAGTHYARAKLANGRRMGIMCSLNGQDATTLTLVEQANMLLFDTYAPSVTKDLAEIDLGQEVSPEIRAAEFLNHRDRAIALRAVARKSFAISGWPIFERAPGRPTYGLEAGLNVQSPVAEVSSIQKIQWVKQHLPSQQKSVFRRPDVKAYAPDKLPDSTITYLLQESKYTPTAASISTAGAQNPDATAPRTTGSQFTVWYGNSIRRGTNVQVVIELMDNNRVHPNHWSRLPDLPTFTHWDDARSFAIIAEWTDEAGIRKRKFVYSTKPLASRPGYRGNGRLNTYAQAIAFVAHLRQQGMDRSNPDHPAFLYDYGIMTIKVQSYDHMNQIMTYTDQINPSGRRFSPSKLNIPEIIGRMRNVGLNAGVPWQTYDRLHSYNRIPRGACDSCHLLNTASRSFQNFRSTDVRTTKTYECKQTSENKDICWRCRDLGRVCSWTAAIHDVPLDNRLITALRPIEGVESIDRVDPSVLLGMEILNTDDY